MGGTGSKKLGVEYLPCIDKTVSLKRLLLGRIVRLCLELCAIYEGNYGFFCFF